jgi:COMMD1 N-terminal domain/COMM domain
MDSAKHLYALLNGLLRRVFNEDGSGDTITVDFVMAQVFKGTDASQDEVSRIFSLYERVLARSALELWDISTLEEMLQKTSLSAVQQQVFLKFWQQKRPQIKALLLKKTDYSSQLASFKWRIDVHARSKSEADLSSASAIVELRIDSRAEAERQSLVRFEMDRLQLASVRHQLHAVQRQLHNLSAFTSSSSAGADSSPSIAASSSS